MVPSYGQKTKKGNDFKDNDYFNGSVELPRPVAGTPMGKNPPSFVQIRLQDAERRAEKWT